MIGVNILLCFFVQLVTAVEEPPLLFRILFGKSASVKEFPFFAGTEVCGGSILSEMWILTAGHCVDNRQAIGRKLLFVGDERQEKSTVYRYSEITLHPKYNRRSEINNDIALLKMATPIKFTDKIQPVKLPRGPIMSSPLVFIGKGLDETGRASKALMKMDVKQLSSEECIRASGGLNRQSFMEKTLICAKKLDGRPGMCMGDSGSPLIQNGAVVGLASFIMNQNCNKVNIGFYTNVVAFVPWIKSVTGIK